MKRGPTACTPVGQNLLVLLLAIVTATQAAGELSKLGDSIHLNGRVVTLRELDTLPCVESEFTRRFRFDSFDNPKLKELRERHRLEQVIAPGKDEFERQ